MRSNPWAQQIRRGIVGDDVEAATSTVAKQFYIAVTKACVDVWGVSWRRRNRAGVWPLSRRRVARLLGVTGNGLKALSARAGLAVDGDGLLVGKPVGGVGAGRRTILVEEWEYDAMRSAMGELITHDEAARLLGCQKRQVVRLANSGHFDQISAKLDTGEFQKKVFRNDIHGFRARLPPTSTSSSTRKEAAARSSRR